MPFPPVLCVSLLSWIGELFIAHRVDSFQCSYRLTCTEPSQGKTEEHKEEEEEGGGEGWWGQELLPTKAGSEQRCVPPLSSDPSLKPGYGSHVTSSLMPGAEWGALSPCSCSRLSFFHLLTAHTQTHCALGLCRWHFSIPLAVFLCIICMMVYFLHCEIKTLHVCVHSATVVCVSQVMCLMFFFAVCVCVPKIYTPPPSSPSGLYSNLWYVETS